MTQEAWLTEHPYLVSVAEFHTHVENAAACVPSALACVPNWSDYEADYLAGTPLLQSCDSQIDLAPVHITLLALINKLQSAPLPDRLLEQVREMQVEFVRDPSFSRHALASLLERDATALTHIGLLPYLSWTVIARYLSRVVGAFGNWREEERWLRQYCPTCGSLPAMAQLVGIDPGRVRLLSCGCCGTRWRFPRTRCPFCESCNDQRSSVLAIEGEKLLRIDYCASCGGYLKTYDGQGAETVMLADWTSLHLDVLAKDRGLKRLATSLYDI